MASSDSASASCTLGSELRLPLNVVPTKFPDMDAVEMKQSKDLKKGTIALLRGDQPCRLTDVSKCKTGKHGKARVTVSARHLLTGRTLEDAFVSGESVMFPKVTREDFHVLNVGTEGQLTLQPCEGPKKDTTREDVSLYMDGPHDDPATLMAQDLSELYWEGEQLIVTVMTVLGFHVVVAYRIDTKAA